MRSQDSSLMDPHLLLSQITSEKAGYNIAPQVDASSIARPQGAAFPIAVIREQRRAQVAMANPYSNVFYQRRLIHAPSILEARPVADE